MAWTTDKLQESLGITRLQARLCVLALRKSPVEFMDRFGHLPELSGLIRDFNLTRDTLIGNDYVSKSRRHEYRMEIFDTILKTHGVEAVKPDGYWSSGYFCESAALYCNQGDTYDITILFDTNREKYILTSWGDWFEKHEQEASNESL